MLCEQCVNRVAAMSLSAAEITANWYCIVCKEQTFTKLADPFPGPPRPPEPVDLSPLVAVATMLGLAAVTVAYMLTRAP